MQPNQLKQKLQNGSPVFGVIAGTRDPVIAEVIGYAGFDFFIMDDEHGGITPAEAASLCRACEVTGVTPFARVRSIDSKRILQFLDAGVMGIVMPGITCAEEVRQLVGAVKYPPAGDRGLGPIRAANYMIGVASQAEYIALANRETMIFPQIEHIEAIRHLDEILQIEDVDGFMIGPRDLAMSMGYYDGPNHEDVQVLIEETIGRILAAGLLVGTVAGSGESARKLVKQGVQLCLHSLYGLLGAAGRAYLQSAQS